MATQIQRAYGLADDRRDIPKGSEARPPKRDVRSERKGDKGDPFPNLPRRRIGHDVGR